MTNFRREIVKQPGCDVTVELVDLGDPTQTIVLHINRIVDGKSKHVCVELCRFEAEAIAECLTDFSYLVLAHARALRDFNPINVGPPAVETIDQLIDNNKDSFH